MYWLLEFYAKQKLGNPIKQGVVHLLVMMYRYRGRATQIVFGEPLPGKPQPPKPQYKNIVSQAVRIRRFLDENPQRSYLHASRHFCITRARVSQLMKIVDNLPGDFIAQMAECQDQSLIHRFSGKTLLRIASMNNPSDMKAHIQHLLDYNANAYELKMPH